MKWCKRQETNKDGEDARQLKTHIKFGADAAQDAGYRWLLYNKSFAFFVFRDIIQYVISTI